MLTPPRFWQGPAGATHWAARLLLPVGNLYGAMVARKLARQEGVAPDIPVVCVGNITLGGVGKTPFTHWLCEELTKAGRTPHVLMRGYGGTEKGPLRVTADHTAEDVGDEAKMLSGEWPVWVAANRPAGAASAAASGADMIVMDDGFQNPSLRKTVSLVLIDGQTGLGNGHIFPAGPLREAPAAALARADAVVMIGEGDPALPPHTRPIFRAQLETDVSVIRGAAVMAFAGIGRPEKFFAAIERAGCKVIGKTAFPDHHPYTESDIAPLVQQAQAAGVTLVTTEKDIVRVPAASRVSITALPAIFTLDNADGLMQVLSASIPRLEANQP